MNSCFANNLKNITRLSEKSRPIGRLFDYITRRRMSLSVLLMMVMKRAPSAPSITRWSKDREIG
jgi:phosphoribosyl-dephospho-CoA transferase